MLKQNNIISDNELSSIYNGLWVVAYSDGHGTIELATEEVFRNEKSAVERAKELNKEPGKWLNDELFVIALELNDIRISISH